MKHFAVKILLAIVMILLSTTPSQAALQLYYPFTVITNSPWLNSGGSMYFESNSMYPITSDPYYGFIGAEGIWNINSPITNYISLNNSTWPMSDYGAGADSWLEIGSPVGVFLNAPNPSPYGIQLKGRTVIVNTSDNIDMTAIGNLNLTGSSVVMSGQIGAYGDYYIYCDTNNSLGAGILIDNEYGITETVIAGRSRIKLEHDPAGYGYGNANSSIDIFNNLTLFSSNGIVLNGTITGTGVIWASSNAVRSIIGSSNFMSALQTNLSAFNNNAGFITNNSTNVTLTGAFHGNAASLTNLPYAGIAFPIQTNTILTNAGPSGMVGSIYFLNTNGFGGGAGGGTTYTNSGSLTAGVISGNLIGTNLSPAVYICSIVRNGDSGTFIEPNTGLTCYSNYIVSGSVVADGSFVWDGVNFTAGINKTLGYNTSGRWNLLTKVHTTPNVFASCGSSATNYPPDSTFLIWTNVLNWGVAGYGSNAILPWAVVSSIAAQIPTNYLTATSQVSTLLSINASNVISGGVLPMGTLSSDTVVSNYIYYIGSDGLRHLTNKPTLDGFNITNVVHTTISDTLTPGNSVTNVTIINSTFSGTFIGNVVTNVVFTNAGLSVYTNNTAILNTNGGSSGSGIDYQTNNNTFTGSNYFTVSPISVAGIQSYGGSGLAVDTTGNNAKIGGMGITNGILYGSIPITIVNGTNLYITLTPFPQQIVWQTNVTGSMALIGNTTTNAMVPGKVKAYIDYVGTSYYISQ